MKRLIGSTRNLIKIGFLAAAVVVATLGLSQEPHAESASNTRIVFSYSSAAPIPAPVIILNPGGVPRDVYIWVTDVKEPSGVSTFQLVVQNDDTDFTVTTGPGDTDGIGDETWLESTDRSGGCFTIETESPPQTGLIVGACATGNPQPTLGPTGSGLLGHVLLSPGPEMGAPSQLVLVEPEIGVLGTYLLDTNFTPGDFEIIPLTLVNSNVVFLGCADNSPPPNGDGVIDLPNDILGVIVRYQMTSSHPDWDPAFDINDDGVIDLPNDILGTIQQYNLPCSRT